MSESMSRIQELKKKLVVNQDWVPGCVFLSSCVCVRPHVERASKRKRLFYFWKRAVVAV
jgi:hypothetical protein